MSQDFTFEGFGDERKADVRAAGIRALYAIDALAFGTIVMLTPVDTGNLRLSNGEQVDEEKAELDFYNSAEYAPDVYYGTKKMQGRPWMKNAIEAERPQLVEVANRAVADYFQEKEGSGSA